MEVIEGNRLAHSIRDKLCDHLYCRDCSMLLDDGGCKVEAWLDSAPSIDIVRCKECKYKPICTHSVQHTTHEPTSVTIGYKSVDFCSYGVRKTNTTAEEKPTPIRDYMVHGEREGE